MRTSFWILAILLSCAAAAVGAPAMEIRVHPGEYVYLYETEPTRDLYSAILHHVAILNSGDTPIELQSLEVQAMQKGAATATWIVPVAELDTSAKKVSVLDQQGVLKMYDFHFQTSRYLPEKVKFAPSRSLEPGAALLVFSRVLSLNGAVDEILLRAKATNASGQPVEGKTSLQARKSTSANEYDFPLSGRWYVAAGPSLQSHHRWVANQEFALDLVTTGTGGTTHEGDGSKLQQFFSYGKNVLAIGDGEVVDVVSDATESDSNLKQPGESWKDFDQRTLAQQGELLAKSYLAPVGNLIVIRHAGGEFSQYAHLQAGSVQVKKGDQVKRGQVIGRLGHSGNSTEPHLHFQVTDGPDPMYSRAVPVKFRNVEVEGLGFEDRYLQTGWLIIAK